MASLAHTSTGQDHDRFGHDGSITMPAPADPVEITAVQKMLSATSGSLLTGLLVTPLDVVRVRWQSQSVSPQAQQPPRAGFQKIAITTPNAFRPTNLGVTSCCREVFFMNNNSEVCVAGPRIVGGVGGAECAVEQAQQRAFNSTFDGLRKIARNEGVTTLWRGLSPTLIMAIPANIIYFTGYEWLRFNHQSPIQRGVKDDYAPLVAGATARVLAAAAVSPIELFRTRLQASQGEPGSNHLADTFRGIKDMVGAHGYRALWRGLTLTLWRDAPFSGMYWLGYETIRGKLTDARERTRGRTLDFDTSRDRSRARRRSQSRENHTETFTDSFIAGALSGAFASVATMPFDVGKTRTQVYSETTGKGAVAAVGKSAAAPEEQTMVRLLWHIFKTEGMAGLFKGWIPRTLKVAPACAIMISSYEVGKRVFRGANERALLRESQAHD
ncbi:mitochondrial carrier domain-containing protein [Apodospora peruviana]|uniref:Mitochondrial carrier domain-containing protein n=1 Tax=Apodospora peruviana TaxID=516989 RepID=A0AAE0IR23_9PEZI|nr:mitochondrial carrier domain-containing protein [Apodospora peruviana]